MRPALIINGHDYSEYVEEITPTRNDLDADGSGRDVQTGDMFRTRIAVKQKWEVKMLRMYEGLHRQLCLDIRPAYYEATILDPELNEWVTREFYTSNVPYGVQRYDKFRQRTYYDGMSFTMTER